MRSTHRVLGVVLTLALVLGACNGGGDDDPTEAATARGASMTSHRRIVAISVAAALVVGACGGDPAEPLQTTSPPLPTETPTSAPTPTGGPTSPATSTTVADVTSTPSTPSGQDGSALATVTDDGEVTITEAQAIVDAHLAITTPPVLDLLATPDDDLPATTPSPLADALLSTWSDGLGSLEVARWDLALIDGLAGFLRDDATGLVEHVVEVTGFDDDCIQVLVEQDRAGLLIDADEPTTTFVELLRDPQKPARNATTWIRVFAEPTPPTGPVSCLDSALAGVADDGEVTLTEAQAIIDAHLAITNPPVLDLLATPDDELPPITPPEIAIALLSTSTDDLANVFIDQWSIDLERDLEGFLRDDATGYVEEVVEVLGSNDQCISLRVAQDFSGVVVDAEGAPVSHIELVRDQGTEPRNPTTWVRNYVAVEPPGDTLSCL